MQVGMNIGEKVIKVSDPLVSFRIQSYGCRNFAPIFPGKFRMQQSFLVALLPGERLSPNVLHETHQRRSCDLFAGCPQLTDEALSFLVPSGGYVGSRERVC